MFDYGQLEALVFVAKEGNFHKAATKLFITQPAISQRIRALEEKVGRPLLVRSHPIRPTAEGQRLISHFHLVALLEGEVASKWQAHTHKEYRPLPIALNTESLSTWFFNAVEKFLTHQAVVLELHTEEQVNTIRMLEEGLVVGCVTSIKKASSGCQSTPLGRMIYRCTATPQFRDKFFSRGVTTGSLAEAPAAHYGRQDDLHELFLSKYFKRIEQRVSTYTYIPSAEGLVEATRRGLAYSILPEIAIENDLKKKLLVDLLPGKSLALDLHWHTTETQAPVVRALTKDMVDYCRKPGSGLLPI